MVRLWQHDHPYNSQSFDTAKMNLPPFVLRHNKFQRFFRLFLYIAVFFPNVGGRYKTWRNDKEMYKNLDEVLETQIPDDASVACNTYLLSHLSNREEIYEIYYHFDKNGDSLVWPVLA
jgi:hypothetical protein